MQLLIAGLRDELWPESGLIRILHRTASIDGCFIELRCDRAIGVLNSDIARQRSVRVAQMNSLDVALGSCCRCSCYAGRCGRCYCGVGASWYDCSSRGVYPTGVNSDGYCCTSDNLQTIID